MWLLAAIYWIYGAYAWEFYIFFPVVPSNPPTADIFMACAVSGELNSIKLCGARMAS